MYSDWIVPDRFSYMAIGDPLDLELHPVGFDVEISIKPDITIRYDGRRYRPPRWPKDTRR